ncbi:MAG: tetratricopeptide repeat protein [Planctomycetota bacterium]|jgi:tetratricopeptide (TPR) repeat protein
MSRTLGVLILACLFGCGQQPIESLRTSGDRLYERGDYASAAAKYAQIADRYPGDWEAHYRLGLCRLEMGELSAARTELKVALTNRPRDPDVVDAQFAEDLGDMDQALRRLRQAYGINPRDPRVGQRLRELGEVPGPTIVLPPGK